MSADFEMFSYFQGKYSDINEEWFADIGSIIVSSMVFTAVYPVIELFGFGGINLLKKLIDQKTIRGYERIPYNTSKTTIGQYYELYAGPIYQIHYKYSSIMNICFVTMLYGPGIPILFPIGLCALSVLYLVERYSVAKYYRMPPNFSDQLNRSCLDAILFSPFLYACLGFWMYSNR